MSTQKALSKELQEIFETDGTLLVGTGTGFSTLAPGTDDQVLTVVGGAPAWADPAAAGTVVDFVDLGDVPASYTGAASKFLKVNATEDALEFVAGSDVAVAWGAVTGTLADQTDLTTALGLKQTADATLTALAALSTSADKLIYATGADTFALTSLTTFSRGLLGQADAASWKSALGVSGGGTSDLKNLVTDYGAVADFVLGPGAIKVSGTDNSTALANAIASGYPIYVPAGNYWISDLTVRYNMQWANLSGPGVFYGSTNVGYAILGKTLAIGSIRSHESGSVGGLNIGGEGGQLGMRQWMGHHNWMQFQPLKYGAPGQVQIYSSNPMGFFYPVATNQIRVCTYTGSTSGVTFPTSSTANTTYGIDVGDIISAGGIQYTVSAVSSTNITLAARSGGDAPAFTAGQISAHTVFVWSSSYETSTGTCNASGSTITWTGGEEIVSTMEHCTIRFVGDATIYTVTGYNWATNTLTISGSKTGTNLSYIQKGHDPGTYQTLLRLQGVAGGAETNCFINYTPNQDMIIGNNGASANYVGRTMFALNSGGTFGRHYWSFNSTPSYKSHTHGGESLRIYSYPTYQNHLTVYGQVPGEYRGCWLSAEGASADIGIEIRPKGNGSVVLGSTVEVGNGNLIDRPYENYVASSGSDGWPDRTTPEKSLLKVGLGSSSEFRTVTAGDAPTGIFMQNYVKPNFTGDPNAYYVGGANFDTIVSGGIGGVTSFAATAYKMPGTYTGDVGIVGGRIGADARDATHYGGIITGFWAFVHGDRAGSGGIAPGIEINSFCNQSWNTTTNYSVDPFVTNGKRSVMGLLINNYQSAVTEYGGSAGDYQNTFGVCLTSLGPGGTNGRAFGYQTGLYLSDCSKENIRIRGGVYGGTGKSDYGIKLEGNAMHVAGIALGPNKFNWGQGTLAGTVSNEGDMLYNESTNTLYFNQGGVTTEMLASSGIGTSGSYTADRKITVRIGNVNYYLLASTTA